MKHKAKEMLKHDIEEEKEDVTGYTELAEMAEKAGLADLLESENGRTGC